MNLSKASANRLYSKAEGGKMQKASCHWCKQQITLANTVLLTESIVMWSCACGVRTHRDVDAAVLAAVCGGMTPQLPYCAAPNSSFPLDSESEAAVLLLGFSMLGISGVDDFLAHCHYSRGKQEAPHADGERP